MPNLSAGVDPISLRHVSLLVAHMRVGLRDMHGLYTSSGMGSHPVNIQGGLNGR